MNLTRLDKLYLTLMVLCFVMGIFVGALIGFDRGQVVLFQGMDGILRDANINLTIDINETHLIEGFRDEFIPIFNQTLQENQFQGPVRPTTNVSNFRETGVSIPNE